MPSTAPTSLDQLQDGQEVPASLLPSNLQTSPNTNTLDALPDGAEVTPDAGQLRKSIDSDPYFPISYETAKILHDDDKAKGFFGRAGATLEAIPSGLSALADQVGAAHEQMSKVPFPTSRNEVERLSNTITEAGAEGALNTTGLVRRGVKNFWDWIAEKATGATDEQRIGDYMKELQLKQQVDRTARGLPDTRPDNFDPSAPSYVLKGYGDAPPYDKAAQVMSMPLDPTFMVGAGALGPLSEAAMKIPGVAKAAQLAKGVGSRILPAAAGAVEQTARAVSTISGAPIKAVDKAAGGLGGITGGLIGGDVARRVPVLGPALQALAYTGKIANATEQTASFFRRLGETSGDQIRSRLLQLAQNPETPAWMKVAAGRLDALKIGDAAQYVSELAKGSAEGGATGAALATAAGSSPEERGQMIGTGLGLGAVGAGTRILTGADAAARRVLADVGAKQRFLERIVKPVESGGSGLSLDEARGIDDTTATVAGHAADLLGDSTNWRVLRPGEAIPGAEPNAAASYDPVTRTISFRLGDTTDRYLHEIGHAVDQASGAPGEARLQIDSIFSPDQLTQFAAQYAQRLAGSNDPATVLGKIQQLNDAWKGDQWLYNEIYAEAGYGTLKGAQAKFGPSFMQSLLGANRSIWGQLAAGARALLFNHILPDSFAQDGTPKLPRGAIFNDPAIYGNPALRKMIVQHLNAIRQNGVTALATKGDVNTVSMPERLLGKHPKAPKQMLMENGLTLQNAKGELRRAAPSEARKVDQVKAKQTVEALAKEPVRPKGSPAPEVAPRVNSEGKTEVTGTRITDLLNKIPAYGPFARSVAAAAEKLMGSGKAFKAGYFAVGTSEGTGNWRKSVAQNSGDMPWQEIHLAPFEFKIDSKAHALITGLSITAADRKIARWAQEGRLDNHWNGDAQGFKRDLMTYLENHRDNRPGADKIGDQKRDLFNLFVAGSLNPKEANPLRASASAQDRGGIIRSLRLDRISSMEDSDHTGWHAEYPKKKINFSPDQEERRGAGRFEMEFTPRSNNNLSNQVGLEVQTPQDLNRLAQIRADAMDKQTAAIKAAGAETDPSKKIQFMQEMMAQGHKAQLAGEAIGVATNSGSWAEGEGGTKLGERPLDWRKNPEVAVWLKENGGRLQLSIGNVEPPKLFSPPVDENDKTGVWYSRMENAIRSLPAGDTKPKSGQQWKGWIARMSQGQSIPTQGKETYRGGIAQEEIKWSGLEDALKDGGKYTKAQVLDLLSKNAVQVQDVLSKAGVTAPDFEHAYHDTQGMDEGQTYHSWQDGAYEIATIVNDEEDPYKSDEYVINFTDPATDRGQGGSDIAKAYSWKDAVSEAEDHAASYNREKGGGKYTDYKAMPGGENYRELLLTLPEREAPNNIPHPEVLTELPAGYEYIHDQQGEPDKQWGILPPNQNHARPIDGRWFKSKEDALYYTLADMNQRAEDKYNRQVRLSNEAQNFDSQHWDEPNVLAHVRFDERKGPNGEKILFLQELQSDWHQQGRDRGYRQGPLETINPLKEKHLARLAEIAKQVTDLGPKEHKFGDPKEQADAHFRLRETREILVATPTTSPGYEEALRNFKEAEAHMRETVPGWGIPESGKADYTTVKPEDLAVILERNVKMGMLPESAKPLAEEARRIKTELDFINEGAARKNKMVPDAPYKHSWPDLVMRRMIKWAADHGFAKIAWTTGKQQNELYNLRKHVRGISYKDNGDQTYNVSAMLPNGAGHMLGERMTQAQVADHIGRELAAKIAAGNGTEVNYAANNQPENIRKELRGLDLEVGGEGMTGFYDRILPITAARLARKYGGEVGTMEIQHPGSTAYDVEHFIGPGEWQRVRGADSYKIGFDEAKRLMEKNLGEKYRVVQVPGERVHALALFNPKGLDDIRQKGVPLFSPEVKDEEPREPFYSQLRRVVDEKFTGKQMPAAQLAAILRNPQNGVKADEMKWSGLDDYLRGKSRVTQEEVKNYLDQNAIKVQEVRKGGVEKVYTQADVDRAEQEAHRSGNWDEFERIQGAHEDQELGNGANGSGNQTKYSKYTMPGGQKYSELLFTLPRDPDWTAVMVKEATSGYMPQYEVRDRAGKLVDRVWSDTPERALRIAAKNSSSASEFRTSHWEEPNVLAHVRFNDRVDSAGRPVKFIEELQSDWHQEGRKKGYVGQVKQLPPGWEIRQSKGHDPVWQIYHEGRWVSGSADWKTEGQALKEFLTNPFFAEARGEIGTVPDAPFKSTWHEMVFRRMVQIAAAEGKSALAWTTGEQQAERYDLSKHLDSVEVRPISWGVGKDRPERVVVYASKDNENVITQQVSSAKLADVIGKELAERALTDIGAGTGSAIYSGLDLKVGGEGMRGFYDKILVDYANKFAKKFGARVRDIQIPQDHDASTSELQMSRAKAIQTLDGGGEIYGVFKGVAGEQLISSYSMLLQAEREADSPLRGWYLGDTQPAATVHALDITPEMRKSAGQGVPLFSPDVSGEYWINDDGVEFADGDVGDFNHEMHAAQHAAVRILDLFHADTDAEFYDEDTFRNAIIEALNEDDEEGKADKHNWAKLAEDYIKANVPADKLEQTLDEFETAQGKGDARDTAVKHWGWVWVRGTHASTWTLTKDDMKNIADGYREIAEQEGLGEDDPEFNLDDMEISIHVASTGRRVNMTLGELESGRTPSKDPTWPGQIPPK